MFGGCSVGAMRGGGGGALFAGLCQMLCNAAFHRPFQVC